MAWILGLTGGIGSGKSTAAALFARFGAPVVDADAISRSLTAAGGAAVSAIQQTFGPTFIAASGAMDRQRMRELVFTNPQAKAKLEAILRPLIRKGCLDALSAAQQQADARNIPFCVFDCPLLIEWQALRERCGRILVIDASAEMQIQRVAARSGLSAERIESIIRAQIPRAERIAAADDIIFNGASPKALEAALVRLCRGWGWMISQDDGASSAET